MILLYFFNIYPATNLLEVSFLSQTNMIELLEGTKLKDNVCAMQNSTLNSLEGAPKTDLSHNISD